MKKLIIFALCAACLLTSCQNKTAGTASSDTGNYEYGVVTQAVGNELIIDLGTVSTSTDTSGDMPQGEKPDFAEGEMPTMPQGEMPDLASGEMPTMPQGDASTGQSDITSRGNGNRGEGGGMGRSSTTVAKTGESKTYNLNVNTPVYMEMGSRSVETTFANIKSGDIVKLTMENDTVTAVSIIGQEATTNASN